MKKIFAATAVLMLISVPARAEDIKYFEDPVYQGVSADDHHPMEDMIMLADEGDLRAQYIMADLYAKGKGGFAKNEKKAKEWFEKSAMNGYPFSFIRLAAMAKHNNKPVEAYQWYTLGLEYINHGPDRKWASQARAALVENKKLAPEEIKEAVKNAGLWEKESADKMRMERAERKKKEEALIGPKKPTEPATQVKTIEKATTTVKTYRNGDN